MDSGSVTSSEDGRHVLTPAEAICVQTLLPPLYTQIDNKQELLAVSKFFLRFI